MSTTASLPVKRTPKRSMRKPPQMSISKNTLRKLYAPVKNPNSEPLHPSCSSSISCRGAITSFT